MRHMVYGTVCRWPSGVETCTPDGHLEWYMCIPDIVRSVDPCIIVQFLEKNPTRYNNVTKFFIILYLYKAQRVSGDTPPIIRSLKPSWQPLVFHTWRVVGRVVGGRCQAQCAWQRPPTFHVWKTRGCQYGFRLLMMGGVSPEKCWASYKYGIIKILMHCCILLNFILRIDQMSY